jgi:hypothetical protein
MACIQLSGRYLALPYEVFSVVMPVGEVFGCSFANSSADEIELSLNKSRHAQHAIVLAAAGFFVPNFTSSQRVEFISRVANMPPIPNLPNKIHVKEQYDEGSYRLNGLVAAAHVEQQCLGYSTLIWYPEGQSLPACSQESRQERIEMKSYALVPRSFQYECTIVAGGTVKYDGKQQ